MSPRGGRVAFIYRDEHEIAIWVRELQNDGQQKLAEMRIQGGKSRDLYRYVPFLDPPAWSPGGSRLAVGLDGQYYSDGHSRIVMIGVSDSAIKEIAVRAERIRDILWSPDGSHLAYITQGHPNRSATDYLDKRVHVTNLETSGGEMVFGNCEGIAWSPDGRYIAFMAENDCMGMRRKVWLLDVSSQQLTQLLTTREKIYKIFWLADGRIAILASVTPSETAPKTREWIISINALPK